MTETTRPRGSPAAGAARGWWRHWPRWTAYAAAGWSLAYAAAGVFWALGGAGFPDGRAAAEADRFGWITPTVPPETGGLVIAVLGVLAAAAALATVRPWGRRIPRPVPLAVAAAAAVTLLLVIPDGRILVLMGSLPTLLFAMATGRELPVDWPAVHQLLVMAGGLAWAGTALAQRRRVAGACVHCGRSHATATGHHPDRGGPPHGQEDRGPGWGTWVTYLAAVPPLAYAITRLGWALWIPVGMPASFVEAFHADGAAESVPTLLEPTLGAMALGGAVLTTGLAHRWGEIWPRWMVGLAGRPVPVWLPVAWGGTVALVVTTLSLHALPAILDTATVWASLQDNTWGTGAPLLLFPLWGPALAAAVYAYHLRRRGRCVHCGRS